MKKNIIFNTLKVVLFLIISILITYFFLFENKPKEYIKVGERIFLNNEYEFYKEITLNQIQKTEELKKEYDKKENEEKNKFLEKKTIETLKLVSIFEKDFDINNFNIKINDMLYKQEQDKNSLSLKEKDIYYKKYIFALNELEKEKDNILVSEEEIENYYTQNKDDFDVVDYRKVNIENEEVTNEIYSQIYDDESLDKLAKKHKVVSNKKFNHKRKKDIEKTIGNWLFDKGRKSNSASILKNNKNNMFYIVYFKFRYKDKDFSNDIFISDITENLKLEKDLMKKDITKEQIEGILKDNNVEYEEIKDIERGIVGEEIENWIFYNKRQIGDKKIIKYEDRTIFILYLNRSEVEKYKIEIKDILTLKKFNEIKENLLNIEVNFLNN